MWKHVFDRLQITIIYMFTLWCLITIWRKWWSSVMSVANLHTLIYWMPLLSTGWPCNEAIKTKTMTANLQILEQFCPNIYCMKMTYSYMNKVFTVYPIIQYCVETPLAGITWSNCFLYNISLSYHCGKSLAHCLLICFSSLWFVGFRLCEAFLMFCHGISIRLWTGLWLEDCNTLSLFFFTILLHDLM